MTPSESPASAKLPVTGRHVDLALKQLRTHGGRFRRHLAASGGAETASLQDPLSRHLQAPATLEDTGLSVSYLTDLVLKHITLLGRFMVQDVADRILLPVPLVNKILESIKKDRLVEVTSGTAYSTTTYHYRITDQGINRGAELMNLCRYAGPAPVSLDAYREVVTAQTIRKIAVEEETVRKAFSHLILTEDLLHRLGPAIGSARTMFLYGPPGNGKTAIAESIREIINQPIYLPHALMVGGQIILIYDPVTHTRVEGDPALPNPDLRWVRVRRPTVITGGELSLKNLDLDFNPISKYYEASLQMKANNGVFIADDFGRQQIEPQRFLNRWIVPLDRNVDYMTLHTGMKFEIPFDMLVVFATNIEPNKLVEEAFLRRIPYKIRVEHPSEEIFEAIFRMVCHSNGIDFQKEIFEYLLRNYYRKLRINLNACHPRDLIGHIIDSAFYHRQEPRLTRETIDMAWHNYLVD